MTETRWLNEHEQRMWRAFQTMSNSLARVLERGLIESAGLSEADFMIMVPLSEAPEHRMRTRELVRSLEWDRSRVSHQIRRMEQRELVARSACPTDARGTFIALTDKGWKMIQAAAPAHVEATRVNFFDVLTEADVSVLNDISRRVSDRIASRSTGQDACAEPAPSTSFG